MSCVFLIESQHSTDIIFICRKSSKFCWMWAAGTLQLSGEPVYRYITMARCISRHTNHTSELLAFWIKRPTEHWLCVYLQGPFQVSVSASNYLISGARGTSLQVFNFSQMYIPLYTSNFLHLCFFVWHFSLHRNRRVRSRHGNCNSGLWGLLLNTSSCCSYHNWGNLLCDWGKCPWSCASL